MDRDDERIQQVHRKIEREKVIINSANAMRQHSNPQVQQSLDSQVREGQKNIKYLEEKLRELQERKDQNRHSSSSQGPLPPAHGGFSPQHRALRDAQQQGPPTSPPKDGSSDYLGDRGDFRDRSTGKNMNDLSGGYGTMPSRAPFPPPAPGSAMPRSRPNYSKLGARSQTKTKRGSTC